MELQVLLLFLWCCSAPVQSSVIHRFFEYRDRPQSWDGAQTFCRKKSGRDLAALATDAELFDLQIKRFYAWIGLKKEDSDWEWKSDSNENGTYVSEAVDTIFSWFWKLDWSSGFNMDAFANHEPGNGHCGQVRYSRPSLYADDCEWKFFIFCKGFLNGDEDGEYYHFYPETFTWDQGQKYCSDKGLQYLGQGDWPVYEDRDFPVWIGLRHDGTDWSWSDGTVSAYRNWASDSAPRPAEGSGSCVAVSSLNKTMSNRPCSDSLPFVCYRHNLALLQEKQNWEDAIESCMNLTNTYNNSSFNLLSVEENDLEYVLSYAQGAVTGKVWVGLRFLAGSWFWSDGSPVSLTLPPCPVGLCGALVVNSTSASDPVIEATDCSEELDVLCYNAVPRWTVNN